MLTTGSFDDSQEDRDRPRREGHPTQSVTHGIHYPFVPDITVGKNPYVTSRLYPSYVTSAAALGTSSSARSVLAGGAGRRLWIEAEATAKEDRGLRNRDHGHSVYPYRLAEDR